MFVMINGFNDPREMTVNVISGVTYEQDNRVEEMYHWQAKVTDLCDLPIEEYMKHPTIKKKDKKPYDAEIEYLESTGTQYIDAMLLLCADGMNFEIEVKFSINSSTSAWGTLINTMQERQPYYGWCLRKHGSGKIETMLNIKSQVVGQPNTIIETTFVVKNSSINNTPTTIFCSLNGDLTPWRFCNSTLYYLKITNKNELVRDFIPVRVGQVGYLYDKVSGELFGNQGTEDFMLGPDKN